MKQEALTPAKKVPVMETPLDDILREMSEWSNRIARRAYDFFAASGFTDGHDVDDWLKAEQDLLKPLAVDLKENKDEFIVKAEVPDFEAKELDIRINGSHLIIEGKHEATEEKKQKETTVTERKSEQIYRAISLPAAVLSDRAKAELKNGVLELRLPKAEKAKQIKVVAA